MKSETASSDRSKLPLWHEAHGKGETWAQVDAGFVGLMGF